MAQDMGVLISWLKPEGEMVSKGDPLFEVETDKAVIEIEAPGTGIISNVSARAGDKIPVGQVIAFLVDEGEKIPKRETILSAEKEKSQSESPPQVSKAGATAITGTKMPRLVAASPKARRLASELDIDIRSLSETGSDGAVHANNIINVGSVKVDDLLKKNKYEVIEIKGMRRAIAERVKQSHQNAPHISLTLSIDMSKATRLINEWNEKHAKDDSKVTITSLLSRAVAKTLTQHPRINGHIIDDEIHQYHAVHLGIVVALEEGLMIPVIRNAQSLSLENIQLELSGLTDRVHKQRLRKEEMSGSTFTISNLGMYGIEQFTSIINPPEVGILSVGAVKEMPVGATRKIVLRPMMQVTLNVDHRAVDGVAAAQFLKSLKNTFEKPAPLFK